MLTDLARPMCDELDIHKADNFFRGAIASLLRPTALFILGLSCIAGYSEQVLQRMAHTTQTACDGLKSTWAC
jgi:hypothetical protein